MSTIVRWVLNWIAKNASASLYTSRTPVGHRIGGHDIIQVADLYIVLSILIKDKPVWSGYFQTSQPVLDIRATHYVSPLSEVDFKSVPLTVHIVNVADETGIISGAFRVYNDTTGLLIFTSDIAPLSLPAGAGADVTALTDFDPPSPLDDTYFVLFDGVASNATFPHGIDIHLGAFHFDVKPIGMGPAPASHHATHEFAGSDQVNAEDLPTTETDDTLVLKPDGAGGVTWQAIPTAKGAFAEDTNATPTPDADLYIQYALTALDQAADFQNPSGTIADGQVLRIRILDDSTPRAITWGAAYASRGAALPAITVAGKLMMVGLIYNNDLGTWDCVAVTTEAQPVTENRTAAAVGTYDAWFTWPGSDKPANVALPDDDSGSGIGSYTAPGGRQSFTLGTGAIPPGDIINSVTVHGRVVHDPLNPASTFRYFLTLGGVEVYGPTLNTPDGPTWYDIEQTITRPGGGSWSLADLTTLEIGIHSVSGDWSWLTTLYAIIDYNPPAPAAAGDILLVF